MSSSRDLNSSGLHGSKSDHFTDDKYKRLALELNTLKHFGGQKFQSIIALGEKEMQRMIQDRLHAEPILTETLDPEGEEHGPQEREEKKILVPNSKHPDFNFIGRIMGPKGATIRQLEKETECKIMVRGKGSLRFPPVDGRAMRPSERHQNEPLHVLIVAEGTETQRKKRLKAAEEAIKDFLLPQGDCTERLNQLKEQQLQLLREGNDDGTSFLHHAPTHLLPCASSTPMKQGHVAVEQQCAQTAIAGELVYTADGSMKWACALAPGRGLPEWAAGGHGYIFPLENVRSFKGRPPWLQGCGQHHPGRVCSPEACHSINIGPLRLDDTAPIAGHSGPRYVSAGARKPPFHDTPEESERSALDRSLVDVSMAQSLTEQVPNTASGSLVQAITSPHTGTYSSLEYTPSVEESLVQVDACRPKVPIPKSEQPPGYECHSLPAAFHGGKTDSPQMVVLKRSNVTSH